MTLIFQPLNQLSSLTSTRVFRIRVQESWPATFFLASLLQPLSHFSLIFTEPSLSLDECTPVPVHLILKVPIPSFLSGKAHAEGLLSQSQHAYWQPGGSPVRESHVTSLHSPGVAEPSQKAAGFCHHRERVPLQIPTVTLTKTMVPIFPPACRSPPPLCLVLALVGWLVIII